jgi:phage portal protein BeeE
VLERHADVTAALRESCPPTVRGVVPSWQEWQAARVLWAMQVPAYRRGVTLISGTVAQLPWMQPDTANPVVAGFLAQPEAGRTAWVTKQRVVSDLVNHGRAFLLIAAVRAGVVTVAQHKDAAHVTVNDDGTLTGPNGETWKASDPERAPVVGRVIVIDGYRDGALIAGVDVLTTAYALEASARMYAETPLPAQVLRNVSDYDLSDDEIDRDVDTYERTRRESSVAYLNRGYDLDTLGWDAQQTALVPQRNEAAIQIARLLNLDPYWLGASVQGSALTYTNSLSLRQDLTDLTLTDYMLPLEQRLAMRDVCGVPVRHDTTEFLRANLTERSTIAVALVGAGIITTTQAAAFVSDRPTGGPA